jgi:acetyl-CoA/propionyl-CoA carboxylase biotin carboxyl carrier protein
LPSPGVVTAYREPSGPGVRVDSGVAAGSEISGVYDPMVAKLIVHGVDREHARRRMLRALDEFVIEGPKTLLGFHKALLEHECFVRGETCHGLVESDALASRAAELDGAGPSNSLLQARTVEQLRTVEVDGRRFDVRVLEPEQPWRELARRRKERVRAGGAGGDDAIVSPMQGTVLSVAVADGDTVETGQVLCIVEAMKMENEVRAPHGGVVAQLSVAAGEPVGAGQVICVLTGSLA